MRHLNLRVSLDVKNSTNRCYLIAANAAGGDVGRPLSAFVTLYINR